MLRASDIFPQAASGWLAALAGGCVGRPGAASGSAPGRCPWWAAWAALGGWVPAPSASPCACWGFAPRRYPGKWINGLF